MAAEHALRRNAYYVVAFVSFSVDRYGCGPQNLAHVPGIVLHGNKALMSIKTQNFVNLLSCYYVIKNIIIQVI